MLMDAVLFRSLLLILFLSFVFIIVFREKQLSVKIEKKQILIQNIKGSGIDLFVDNKRVHVKAESQEKIMI